MLAIKLHYSPRPALVKNDWLIPSIKWTKDLRLLYHGDEKRKKRKNRTYDN
jgi:hypothetical protein